MDRNGIECRTSRVNRNAAKGTVREEGGDLYHRHYLYDEPGPIYDVSASDCCFSARIQGENCPALESRGEFLRQNRFWLLWETKIVKRSKRRGLIDSIRNRRWKIVHGRNCTAQQYIRA